MTLENYHRELAATDPAKRAPVKPGSAEEKAGIEAFRAYYKVFAAEVIRRDTKRLYAKDAFFKDGYKEVKGAEAIETYFLATTEAVVSCTFDITDVSVHEGNYYFLIPKAGGRKAPPAAPSLPVRGARAGHAPRLPRRRCRPGWPHRPMK